MGILGKKGEKKESKSDVPVQAVISMRDRGLTNEQIINQLKSQGYKLQSIRDALTQAEVKSAAVMPKEPEMPPPLEAPPLPPPPMPGEVAPSKAPEMPVFGAKVEKVRGAKIEEMERILEEIVDERWKDVTARFKTLEELKGKIEVKIDELNIKVNGLVKRMDNISNVMMTKVEEYDKTMKDVDVEIKALEKVMQKLVPNMAEQVKELRDIVTGLRGSTKTISEI